MVESKEERAQVYIARIIEARALASATRDPETIRDMATVADTYRKLLTGLPLEKWLDWSKS